MEFYSKVKWVLGILMVFILIVATNLIDRNNFKRVNESVVAIYEDRLIASNLVFEMFKLVNKKEVALKLTDTLFFNQENEIVNTNINNLVLRFELTKLTPDEHVVFDDFKNNFETLKSLDNNFISSNFKNKINQENMITHINKNLDDLSKIQLTEGKRQMSIGKKALSSVEFLTQLEICLLILLAITIQIIVMYKPK
ncbi:MCP four helix bundle domain-containing protein [uncultured Algibacter sp.]|uniref:MCP four helix bundle domain-containing protein n=1 Tax=uncultured Algibacter sp. TaxID=298659 RepID=UPI00261B75E2|nr:MCP four helix bundle domain-containing protein [uncultured Algibacter sp.]